MTYEQRAQNQKVYAYQLAGRITNGEALSEMDKAFAAELLRHWADGVPDEPPKQRGQQPQFSHGNAAVMVGVYSQSMSLNKSREAVAEHYGVSKASIENAWREHHEMVETLLLGVGKQNAD